MRILIAPDSFKGSLTSVQAVDALAAGIKETLPEADVVCLPLADGGEGTAAALLDASEAGEIRHHILYIKDSALLESALWIGLSVAEMQVDVLKRGSSALGLAIVEALDAGVNNIQIALGGSATVDAGLGLLMALGCRVLDADGLLVSADLNGLMRAKSMDISNLDRRVKDTVFTVLSDVQNPLCGKAGAVYMYGVQKGVQVDALFSIDRAMLRWAHICELAFGLKAQTAAGAGAAGGLGFALQLLGADLLSGAEYVMQACGFDQLVDTVDWVVTGEGCSDAQSLQGKLPVMVARRARQSAVRVALISGEVMGIDQFKFEFDDVTSVKPEHVPLHEVMQHAAAYLRQGAALWARKIGAVAQFPNISLANDEGLLAVGGDLKPSTLLAAYSQGIFPWYAEQDQAVLWWSPDPRMVLFPGEFHCSKRLARRMRQDIYTVSMNESFEDVIQACANTPRRGEDGTWIFPEMIAAYCKMFELGYAHSVEVWQDNHLIGGLYGILHHQVFFAESMFSLKIDASKMALAMLCEHAMQQGWKLIDCQFHTNHLQSLGARKISRDEFSEIITNYELHDNIEQPALFLAQSGRLAA